MPHRADALPFAGTQSPLRVSALLHVLCVAACGFAAATGLWRLPLEVWLLVEGVTAAAAGRVFGLPWWWVPINLLFFPAIYMLLGVEVPPIAFLVAFCLLLLVNGAAWCQRVPLFLSSDRAADMVRTLLPVQNGFRFIDLGCGTGTMLTSLARQRPDGHFSGVELAPLPYLLSRWRILRRHAVNVRWGSLWNVDLANYDVVYVYLSPVPMAKLWDKACREMRPGSLLVSNGFCIPGVVPTQTLAVGDAVRSTLYLWRM
ncbi:MAG: class I SAM-dependent methyltransferase [Burkholderiales bacterium]